MRNILFFIFISIFIISSIVILMSITGLLLVDERHFSTLLYSLLIEVFFTIIVLFKYTDLKGSEEANNRLKEAEEKAFSESFFLNKTENETQDNSLEVEDNQLEVTPAITHNSLTQVNLFNLYSKQIEKYQLETRSRASWSFIFAIMAMFFGMGFVFWGGFYMLSNPSYESAVIGGVIASIGGAVSAYITNTFLNIHKVSVLQLNRYFSQPVINDHILMAQRLADAISNDKFREEKYSEIIESINRLIISENGEKNL